MIQSWENLVTDGQTDRQSDFIERCPTNVEVQKCFNKSIEKDCGGEQENNL